MRQNWPRQQLRGRQRKKLLWQLRFTLLPWQADLQVHRLQRLAVLLVLGTPERIQAMTGKLKVRAGQMKLHQKPVLLALRGSSLKAPAGSSRHLALQMRAMLAAQQIVQNEAVMDIPVRKFKTFWYGHVDFNSAVMFCCPYCRESCSRGTPRCTPRASVHQQLQPGPPPSRDDPAGGHQPSR